MITEADFYKIAKSRPEMMRAYYKAVDAIIEVRKEVATNQSGLWATARLRKKQFTATFLLLQFTNGFIFNGQPLLEEDKKLVRNWIEGAATFHMLPEEEKNRQLLRNARDIEEEELLLGGRTSGIITALAPTGLSTRFSRAGFVYVVSTAHVKDFGGFYQTAILKYSSTDWEAGHLANRQFVYRIEVMSQLRSVQEHIDTVKMALSKKEDAWEGTKAYQDDVIKAHGRRNYCPQEMSWTDKRIRDIVSAADINYASASEKELGGEISAELLLARGIAFAEKGQFDRAIADYDEAIRLDPQYADAFNHRGFSYGKKGDYDHAIADHDEAIKLNPKDAVAFGHRATAYVLNDQYDRAIADYDEAIRLDGNFALPFAGRGMAYSAKGQYDHAIADYDEAIRLDRNFAEAFALRGIAYSAKGQHDRAFADYDEAIRLNPQDTNAFNNRGNAYFNKGDYDRAIADYDEAIRLNPKNAHFFHRRGATWVKKGQFDRAITDLDEAIRLDPKDADFFAVRGKAYENNDDCDRAIADYDEAIRLNPNFTWVIKSRAEAIAKKNELGGSTEELRLRWLEDNDIRRGLEDAVLRLSSGEVLAGNDLHKLVEDARTIRNLLRGLHSRYNRQVVEQAVILSVLNPHIFGDPKKAVAAVPYIARRLDALSEETERGWHGEFTEGSGFRFERTLRGVKEVAVLDQALLGSADARKLDEFAPELQKVFPRVTPPAILKRKDEETPIHGPVDLFEAVMAVGRKVARSQEGGPLREAFVIFQKLARQEGAEASQPELSELQPKSSVLNNFDFGKFQLDEKLDDLTGLVEFSPEKYAIMIRRFKGEKNYDAPPINFLGRPWQLMLSTVHGQICKVAIDICLSNEREATPIATEALQYCKERLGSPTEQKTGLFVWDTKDGNVVLQTTEGAEGFLIAIYLTSSAIRKFELL